jgi:hypothetical protein
MAPDETSETIAPWQMTGELLVIDTLGGIVTPTQATSMSIQPSELAPVTV